MIPERIRLFVCPICGWKSLLGREAHYLPPDSAGRVQPCKGEMAECVYGLILAGSGPQGRAPSSRTSASSLIEEGW